jgi:hypothetical protein
MIIEYDEAGRTLTYEASAGMPAFVSLARNTWRVTAIEGDRTVASFAAQLEVRGALGRLPRWWLLAQVGRNGGYLLADLKHFVEQGAASPRKQRPSTGGCGRRCGSTLRSPCCADWPWPRLVG